uniref:RING-type domain-containing protein n=1 Tax=Moniliophthora roreri TaxID=221103 RepID=A0A0W0FFD5_MONRR
MGQSSSRARGEEPATTSRARRDPVPQDNSPSPSTSSTKAKRRSNIRKSLINLVKPSSKKEDSSESSSSANRKSWRRSRRWSRAPVPCLGRSDVEDGSAEQSQATTTTSATILPAASITSPKDKQSASASTITIPVSPSSETQELPSDVLEPDQPMSAGESSSAPQDRGHDETAIAQEHAISGESQEEDQFKATSDVEQPIPATTASEFPSSDLASPPTRDLEKDAGTCTAEAQAQPSSEASTSTNILPTVPEQIQTPELSSSAQPSSPTNTTQNQTANRPFPPPGTLVVVQGVVHTTDVPRPPSSAFTAPPPFSQSTTSPEPSYLHSEAQTQTDPSPQSHSTDSGLDVRRSASSTPRSRPNRLSTLFGSRPASVNAGRPSSSRSNFAEYAAAVDAGPEASTSSTTDTHTVNAGTVASGSSISPDSSDASVSSHSNDTRPTSEEVLASNAPTSHEHERPASTSPSHRSQSGTGNGMISSSSIDILGTLLSVAAAATAASLLTGSSEPILSSGLAPPRAPGMGTGTGTGTGNNMGMDTGMGMGMGIGRGLGGFGGLGGLGGSGNMNANGPAGRADRMRQAWGNIRERLGLRGANGSGIPATPPSHDQGEQESGRSSEENVPLLSDIDGSERPPTMEARDRMLAEMSRAFQLGLGLNSPVGGAGDTGNVEASLGADPIGSRLGEMPPEGSFERFLVDLQADLRVALGGGAQQQQQSRQPLGEMEPEDDDETPRDGEDGDSDSINELFRLIAEAEAEVRQRQRMIAQRQSALRALVSGTGLRAPSSSSSTTESAAAPSPDDNAVALSSSSPPAPRPDRRARVESVFDSEDGIPALEDISDAGSISAASSSSSDSDDESTEDQGGDRDHQRTEASLARLASMVSSTSQPAPAPAPPAVNQSVTTGAPTGVNSISEMLNRRRAMGIGQTPPVPPPAPAPAPRPVVAPEPSTSSPHVRTEESRSHVTSSHRRSEPRRPPAPIPSSATEPLLRAFDDDLPRASTAIPSSATFPQPHAENRAPEDGAANSNGRINWWRLYRFPPIAAPPPRTPGQGRATHVPPPPTSFNTSPSPSAETTTAQPNMSSTVDSTPLPPQSSTPAPASAENSTPSQDQQPQTTGNNIVVPVIVTAAGPEGEASDEQDGATDDQDRGPRRWTSRAADAFRNLRPGRRASQPPTGLLPDLLDGPGSRTFLIYVIGGYYPPDHTIVTGDPESFNSWETLLDLAELLGQIKPPTASREEIERSGLEVIKSPLMKQYEEEGKISSNCTDRCLICLDDYVPEDDVRVLTCKHAFHMECVDKWLQEGKNNCPACRGTGVASSSS